MKSVANILLRARAWQVFLLIAGFVPAVIVTRLILSGPDAVLGIRFGFAVGTEVVFICVSLWLWSLGTFLESAVSPSLRPSGRFFYVSVIFPVIYIPLFEVLFPKLTTHPVEFALIFLIHFFAVFCGFYNYYFIADTSWVVGFFLPVSGLSSRESIGFLRKEGQSSSRHLEWVAAGANCSTSLESRGLGCAGH